MSFADFEQGNQGRTGNRSPRQSTRVVRIERAARLFSQRRGTPLETNVAALFGAPVYGLAIHTTSEVRAVRVAVASGALDRAWASPVWTDVVEGCPVEIEAGASDALQIETLDQHDGALVLQAALTPSAVWSLCADYASQSQIVFGRASASAGAEETTTGETMPGGGESIIPPGTVGYDENLEAWFFDLAPPRCTVSLARKIEASIFVYAGTGDVTLASVLRDRAGSVVVVNTLSTTTLAAGANAIAQIALGAGVTHGRIYLPRGLELAGRVALL